MTGVILTRAQPIHLGHIDVIKQIIQENHQTLIVIGSANKASTKRNPFSISMREYLLKNALTDFGLIKHVQILSLPDWSMEDAYQYAKEWGNFLYYAIAAKCWTKQFTLYYNDDISIAKNWFDKTLQNRITIKNAKRTQDISSTAVRQALLEHDDSFLQKTLSPSTYKERDILSNILQQCETNEIKDHIMQ